VPEPEHAANKVKEFLLRKAGPLPYWAWGAAGILVIGGTIWMTKHGGIPGLGSLTGDGGGGGTGSGGIPPIDIPGVSKPASSGGPPAVDGGTPPIPPPSGGAQPVYADLLLIGQQSGDAGGGVARTTVLDYLPRAFGGLPIVNWADPMYSSANDPMPPASWGTQQSGVIDPNEPYVPVDFTQPWVKGPDFSNPIYSSANDPAPMPATQLQSGVIDAGVISTPLPTTQVNQVQYVVSEQQQAAESHPAPAPAPEPVTSGGGNVYPTE
jgi:hypothetical protein